MKIQVICKNETQTMALAEKLAQTLKKPTVISLVGDLGAGKTTFTKGFAKGMGMQKMITSPTFTILNEYIEGDKKLYHFDMYRLESEDEARAVGFETYFDTATLDGHTIVEWAQNTQGLLPKSYMQITLEKIDDDQRKITVEQIGE